MPDGKSDPRSQSEHNYLFAAVGAALVVTIIFSIALVAAFGPEWFKSFLSGSAPAWIQAGGSVIAILVAGRIAASQIIAGRQIEAIRRIEEDKKRIFIIDALLRSLESDVLVAEAQFKKYPRMPIMEYYVERILASSEAVSRIDPVSCPPSVIESILRLYPEPCGTLLDSIEQFNKSFNQLEDAYDKCEATLSNSFVIAKMMLGIARSNCANIVEALRSSPELSR